MSAGTLHHKKENSRQKSHSKLASILIVSCASMILAGCGGSSGGTSSPNPVVVTPEPKLEPIKANGIEVTNFSNNETLRYSLPILIGRVTNDVKNIQVITSNKSYVADVVDGNFKALIPLQFGLNEVSIKAGEKSTSFKLNYLASDNPRKVRMMYAIAADDDGRFVAEPGMPNSIEDAKARLQLQALLMQSATAEMMYKATRQRVTYSLVADNIGTPVVSTLRLPMTRAQLYAMSDNAIYGVIAQTLKDANVFDGVKSMVTMGFSHYQSGEFLGHAALGGGNLGIFGGLHLYACPTSLEQVSTSFINAKVTRHGYFAG